jgi:hypothetical protein
MWRVVQIALMVLCLIAIAFTSACSTMKPQDFADQSPILKPEQYFVGETKGHGVFYDRFRNLKTRFIVSLSGAWDGTKVLSLKERLSYQDGTKTERTFTITKQNEHLYEVTMADLVGPGTIEVFGNCMRWSYRLNQDVGGGRIVTLTFDDWMFLQEDGVVLNRAYASKFGIGLGEVFMSVQKLS